MHVDLLFHTGSTRDASDAHIASADVMALVPLMGIGLVLPILNLEGERHVCP